MQSCQVDKCRTIFNPKLLFLLNENWCMLFLVINCDFCPFRIPSQSKSLLKFTVLWEQWNKTFSIDTTKYIQNIQLSNYPWKECAVKNAYHKRNYSQSHDKLWTREPLITIDTLNNNQQSQPLPKEINLLLMLPVQHPTKAKYLGNNSSREFNLKKRILKSNN